MRSRCWLGAVLSAALSLGALALACGPVSSGPPVVGTLDGGAADSSKDVASPLPTCAMRGGKCTSVAAHACPVQITGIGLCAGEQICCTGFRDE